VARQEVVLLAQVAAAQARKAEKAEMALFMAGMVEMHLHKAGQGATEVAEELVAMGAIHPH
jgi:hypothetical protein